MTSDSLDTLCAQALGRPEPAFRGVQPAIYPSVTYERDPDGSYPGGHSYSRDLNPTFDLAEEIVCRLEGGHEALLFASGMAAATALFEATEPGTHFVIPEHMYWTVRLWIGRLAGSGRIRLSVVPNGDERALTDALTSNIPTLVWVETPSNPMCAVTDIERTCAIAHESGASVAVDSTAATPVLTRPIELGADFVFHSATKQLNGHGDVLAGVLVAARESATWEGVHRERAYRGGVAGPFEAWLLARGLRTLHLRVRRSAESALRIAEALHGHPSLEEILYPGLPTHLGHDIARRQMDMGFGPIVSLRLRDGAAACRKVVERLRLFHDATSLGGPESLVEHRAPIEGEDTPVPEDLLRLSVGLEDASDLVADLQQALEAG